jgi:seryl-tRNA synthetase
MSGPDRFRFDASVSDDGRATLGPHATGLLHALDANFAAWGAELGAHAMTYPPLMSVADLAGLDYFDNFPHLASVVAGLHPETYGTGLGAIAPRGAARPEVAPQAMAPASHALPSAACYSSYLALRGTSLGSEPLRITTRATCFRREPAYDGLRRLHGFTMREIICIGSREQVLDQLAALKQRVSRFLVQLDLDFDVDVAEDPFFDPNGARSVMQRLFPVKEEFLVDGGLAIASVNFHRNFFGERCSITLPDGSPGFTGCVAFGLERWLAALAVRFGDEAERSWAALSRSGDWQLASEPFDIERAG